MGEAAQRWQALAAARIAEVERVQPGRGGLGPAFWDARARRYTDRVAPAEADPFTRHVRAAMGRRATVLDVGSGPGRFALALAPHAKRVTAVDPSKGMLRVLRRQVRERGLTNVSVVNATWEEAELARLGPADVAICSFVLPLVVDAAPFVRKLDAAASRRVLLYLGAWCTDAAVDPFWRYFHGSPRLPPPTYLDAAALVQEEVGVRPSVRVVELPTRGRYESAADAVGDYRDWLMLPDTAAVRRELVDLLGSWLVRRGGALRPPLRTTPAAILEWEPARR